MLVAIVAASLLGGASPAEGAIRQSASSLAGLAPANASQGPGCAIGVSTQGEEQYAAWGLADIDHAVPVSRDTVFHAASLAKQFTAYAIGRLVADRRLRLDDDVRRYLPELPDYGRPITIGHLVHHTSGLRDQGALLFLAGWRSDDRVARSDALRAIYRQQGLNFLPGEQDLYNNSGYTLLGEIVARVTGRSLAGYAQETIFRPLGLRHTRFYDDPSSPQPRRARAYRRSGQAWNRAEPNMEVYGHDGLDGGYSARILAVPSAELAIAILCNGAPQEPDRLVEALLDRHLPSSPTPSSKDDFLRHDLAIAGLYWSPENDAVMELYTDPDGSLHRRSPSGRLVQTDDGLLEIGGQRWRYESAHDGRPPRLLALFDPLPPRSFELIPDPNPRDADVRALAGTYRSDEQATSYEVTVQGSQLAIAWPRTPPILLSPAGRDRFFSTALGTVTFNRTDDVVTGLTISLRRAWRVAARRIEPVQQ